MTSNLQKTVLPNGVRILCEPLTHVQSAAVGIWCQTGSRMERDDEAGISHLIEHMLFKGTSNRTGREIVEAIEGRGGHLNAFTDREVTCFYARVLGEEAIRGLDVLSDMIANSKIEPADLEVEKRVVQEEIRKYHDSPEELVHDLHAQHRWGDHPLGKPIIGTSESVGSFQRENLVDYMARRYRGDRVVVAAAGNLDPDEMVTAAERALGSLSEGGDLPERLAPVFAQNFVKHVKDVEQVHFCLGTQFVDVYSERRQVGVVLDAILGGGMSSRLFQEIREKRGLAYAIGSYISLFREGGAFTVYGGTSSESIDEALSVVREELARVVNERVDDVELERTKNMLCGEMVLGLEGMSARMSRMARNELTYEREVPVEEALEKIRNVTAKDVQELAAEFFMPEGQTVTLVGPA